MIQKRVRQRLYLCAYQFFNKNPTKDVIENEIANIMVSIKRLLSKPRLDL